MNKLQKVGAAALGMVATNVALAYDFTAAQTEVDTAVNQIVDWGIGIAVTVLIGFIGLKLMKRTGNKI